ncbi:hypothetical protein PoB_004065900 [Plakobranchus ocellatus]|uniref:Secreted protein n=1 Tax=Plakobranchus ocellatus TaxID=259542 RepID=A0AAV4B644_9GAST|nr:hypothetical protein PoB_004065900 [Plakobranchus ocellatus]
MITSIYYFCLCLFAAFVLVPPFPTPLQVKIFYSPVSFSRKGVRVNSRTCACPHQNVCGQIFHYSYNHLRLFGQVAALATASQLAPWGVDLVLVFISFQIR